MSEDVEGSRRGVKGRRGEGMKWRKEERMRGRDRRDRLNWI
jgi:hypothetical protein